MVNFTERDELSLVWFVLLALALFAGFVGGVAAMHSFNNRTQAQPVRWAVVQAAPSVVEQEPANAAATNPDPTTTPTKARHHRHERHRARHAHRHQPHHHELDRLSARTSE